VSPYRAWPFLSDPNHPFLSAVWAVAIHGIVALVAIAPIVWRSEHRLRNAGLTFIGGSVLDVDHFVAAGSLNLHTIETMAGRPATHSLVFIVVLALLAWVLTRRWVLAWSVFAVSLAHLLFDAAGGGERLLYPLAHPDGLPWLACPLGTLALCAASAAAAGVSPRAPARLQRAARSLLGAG
jgi:membrane-bound metal-dependent hydrolase YbcI (DUF457 family)